MVAIRSAALFSVFLFLCSCASTLPPYYPTTSTIKTPKEGVLSSSELGDTLLIHSIKEEYDSLKIGTSVEYGVCLFKVRINSQTALAASLSEYSRPIFHAALEMNSMYTNGFVPAGYARIEESTESTTGYKFTPVGTGCGGPQDFLNEYTKTKSTKVDKPGFSQELIYNGRVGDYVKFVYREFSAEMARSAFTQEIQYDLSLSNIVGFKGVRLEIVEATNARLDYKVLKHFEGL